MEVCPVLLSSCPDGSVSVQTCSCVGVFTLVLRLYHLLFWSFSCSELFGRHPDGIFLIAKSFTLCSFSSFFVVAGRTLRSCLTSSSQTPSSQVSSPWCHNRDPLGPWVSSQSEPYLLRLITVKGSEFNKWKFEQETAPLSCYILECSTPPGPASELQWPVHLNLLTLSTFYLFV